MITWLREQFNWYANYLRKRAPIQIRIRLQFVDPEPVWSLSVLKTACDFNKCLLVMTQQYSWLFFCCWWHCFSLQYSTCSHLCLTMGLYLHPNHGNHGNHDWPFFSCNAWVVYHQFKKKSSKFSTTKVLLTVEFMHTTIMKMIQIMTCLC